MGGWSGGGSSGGSGTVTSVAASVPSILSVSGSPVTTTGTLAVTLATQTANKLFAGPASGGAATPTFRDPVTNDTYWAAAGAIGTDVPSSAIFTDLQGNVITGTTRIDVPNIGTSSGNQHALPSGTAALVASDDVRLTGWDASATLSTAGFNQTIATLSPGTGLVSTYELIWDSYLNGDRTKGASSRLNFTVYFSGGNAVIPSTATLWTHTWSGAAYSVDVSASGATVLVRVSSGAAETSEHKVSYRLMQAY